MREERFCAFAWLRLWASGGDFHRRVLDIFPPFKVRQRRQSRVHGFVFDFFDKLAQLQQGLILDLQNALIGYAAFIGQFQRGRRFLPIFLREAQSQNGAITFVEPHHRFWHRDIHFEFVFAARQNLFGRLETAGERLRRPIFEFERNGPAIDPRINFQDISRLYV